MNEEYESRYFWNQKETYHFSADKLSVAGILFNLKKEDFSVKSYHHKDNGITKIKQTDFSLN